MIKPKKILLAEDDSDDQKLFHEFLQDRSDISLMQSVENGVELFNVLESTGNTEDLPDIIVLDQNMPKRNGIQTLQMLKENNHYNKIPVLIYSTYTDQQLMNTAIAMGASSVMSKPISKEGYNEMINTFLKIAFGAN